MIYPTATEEPPKNHSCSSVLKMCDNSSYHRTHALSLSLRTFSYLICSRPLLTLHSALQILIRHACIETRKWCADTRRDVSGGRHPGAEQGLATLGRYPGSSVGCCLTHYHVIPRQLRTHQKENLRRDKVAGSRNYLVVWFCLYIYNYVFYFA